MSAPPPHPLLSPDGQWVWNGSHWVPNVAPVAPVASQSAASAMLGGPSGGTILGQPGRGSRKVKLTAGIGLAVLALSAGGFVAFGRGNLKPAASLASSHSAAAHPAVVTPNMKCAEEVYDATADMANNDLNNDPAGLYREQRVAGQSDPVFQMASLLFGSVVNDLVQVGQIRADANLEASAYTRCLAKGNPTQDADGGPSGYTPDQGSQDGDQVRVENDFDADAVYVAVPDVFGQNACAAKSTFEHLGLTITELTDPLNGPIDCTSPSHNTTPNSGTMVEKGTNIQLDVGLPLDTPPSPLVVATFPAASQTAHGPQGCSTGGCTTPSSLFDSAVLSTIQKQCGMSGTPVPESTSGKADTVETETNGDSVESVEYADPAATPVVNGLGVTLPSLSAGAIIDPRGGAHYLAVSCNETAPGSIPGAHGNPVTFYSLSKLSGH